MNISNPFLDHRNYVYLRVTRVRSEGKVDVIVISINMDVRQGAEK